MKKLLLSASLSILLSTSSAFSVNEDDLIPNVKCGNANVVTGIKYAVLSLASNSYLDGRDKSGDTVLVTNKDKSDRYLQWVIEPTLPGQYVLQSLSSSSYLDGRGKSGDTVFVTDRARSDGSFQWVIEPTLPGQHVLKSLASNSYLDGRDKSGDPVFVTSRDKSDGSFQWSFIPTSYKLSAYYSDFNFGSDIQSFLEKNLKVDFVDSFTFEVGEDTVGSKVSKTLSKSFTNSFAWGLNESLGISMAFEASIDIPLLASAKMTTTYSASVGSNQNWSKEETNTIEITSEMTPQKVGTYKMSGWLKTVQDVEMPFDAKITFKATGDRLSKCGNFIHPDAPLQKDAVAFLLKYAGLSEKLNIINSDDPYGVVSSISGTMKASYGMDSYVKTEKLSS